MRAMCLRGREIDRRLLGSNAAVIITAEPDHARHAQNEARNDRTKIAAAAQKAGGRLMTANPIGENPPSVRIKSRRV